LYEKDRSAGWVNQESLAKSNGRIVINELINNDRFIFSFKTNLIEKLLLWKTVHIGICANDDGFATI